MCRLKKNLMCFRCDNIQSAGARAVEHRLASAPLPLAPGDADWVFSPFAHIKLRRSSEFKKTIMKTLIL